MARVRTWNYWARVSQGVPGVPIVYQTLFARIIKLHNSTYILHNFDGHVAYLFVLFMYLFVIN